jgi:hypothetical protein
MNLRALALGLALPLAAQDPGPDIHLGLGFHTAFPTGALSNAVNDHNGFGIALQAPIHLGGGLTLRPQLEGTGFRITRYDPLAWTLDSDNREILRTYRAGADVLLNLSGRSGGPGPYLLAGAALQHASIDWVVQDREGQDVTADTRFSETGLALSVGAGVAFGNHAALELRAYRFDYQDPSTPTATGLTRRQGTAILLGVVFSF